MIQDNAAIGKAFYTSMGEKKIEEIAKYLHPHVQFSAPLAKLQGKEAYLEALKNFINYFNTLTIRATFAEDNHALVVYDADCPAPVGHLPSAALMSFSEGLITTIELFYDARPFDR